jgi:hypothetical protein
MRTRYSANRLCSAASGEIAARPTSSINIWNRVLPAGRVTREHLLRLEYRIADLASPVAPPNSGPENTTPMR